MLGQSSQLESMHASTYAQIWIASEQCAFDKTRKGRLGQIYVRDLASNRFHLSRQDKTFREGLSSAVWFKDGYVRLMPSSEMPT